MKAELKYQLGMALAALIVVGVVIAIFQGPENPIGSLFDNLFNTMGQWINSAPTPTPPPTPGS